MDLFLAHHNPNKIIITDTSVLINFLQINRIDLLEKHPGKFLITDHVVDEVTKYYSLQQQRLKAALEDNILSIIKADQPEEIQLFGELRQNYRLGAGECSAIACAIHRNYLLAIDDIRARKQAEKLSSNLQVITTQMIMVHLIHDNVLTIDEADSIKNEWQKHYKFLLKINSFKEIIA